MAVELLILAATFPAALAGTRLLISQARGWGLMDQPTARGSHSRPTPRGGGAVIAAVFLSGLTGLFLIGRVGQPLFAALLGGGTLVAVIGLLDDRFNLSVGLRLFVHCLAACWAVYQLQPVFGDKAFWGHWPGQISSLIGLVWLLNLYNFMDGIDGLAASQAVFLALAMAALAGPGSPLALPLVLLALGCGGFLIWNWPPASIFMGDVGSGFIGYTLGVTGLYAIASDELPLGSMVILSGVFLVDATFTLLRRVFTGQSWYQAHRSHAYQQAAKRYHGHRPVLLAILAVDILWLAPLAWLSVGFAAFQWLLVLVALGPLGYMAIQLKAGLPETVQGT